MFIFIPCGEVMLPAKKAYLLDDYSFLRIRVKYMSKINRQ